MTDDRIHRRVRRAVLTEGEYVNTINIRDRVTIDFVWYPGAPLEAQSRIETTVPNDPRTRAERNLTFTWSRLNQTPVTKVMSTGSITISLPPGSSGTLTAFGTTWEIRRPPRETLMAPVNQIRGVQQRLNRLGYHLRAPGALENGVDSAWGRRTEVAVLQFQVDYNPPVGAPAAAANRLKVRGEWTGNTHATYLGNVRAYHCNACPNPSAADGNSLQAALRARVGA